MGDSLWYPSVEDVLAIHEDIVAEYTDTPSGVQNRGDIEFALTYIEEGHFGAAPESIHEKAYHLMRLLVANHPFVDANKRTALNTVTVFYFLNGHRFAYDDEIRSVLKQFGTDERTVSEEETVEYLRAHTEPLDLVGEIEQWRDDLLQYGVEQLTEDTADQND
ncbi:type II toxin-antitoxin system death-on-curing family toxin [Halobacterium bonnevillei]|uniref:Type II toxin-antitoxin system death-on-curing family toxin n=1 Tax=Halobacterium bonnevillei TaxID=2692200 RepID=A0A6B0SC44_9EURY|nr:type II toxin-antitoxin system death-on-curing family toxin [Halobacterium bonnevillei]MXR19224.1 type II toxin-antitoxin system death-on-curing family toxin [Halobacterium bonnevillei]